ncbi:MRGX4 protein, partial [Amazona guildingii]|nr:MRGX4 protein [Amazona guildingii]
GLHLNYTHYGNWSYEAYQESECPDFSVGFIILTVFLLGVSVFGMVGNGIVLWFLGFQMKWNPCTIYVLNLAVADCSVLLLRFLFTLGWFNFKVLCFHLHYFIRFRLKIIEAFHFLCRFFVLSSLGLLTAISTDRCVSVV